MRQIIAGISEEAFGHEWEVKIASLASPNSRLDTQTFALEQGEDVK